MPSVGVIPRLPFLDMEIWSGATSSKKSPLIRAHKHFPKSPDSSSDAVANAGEKKAIVNVYGWEDDTINTLRLTSFVKSAAASNIKISTSPHHKEAARYQSLKTYHH